MSMRNSKISEAEAHQELVLMDSRVSSLIDEGYFERFRRMDLPYSGLLARFRDLLSETRWCGGQIIHLGKLLCNEVLEFMESDPQVPSGMLLESALKALGQSIPFLGSILAPIAAEVECQGFSRVLATAGYTEKLDDRARVFFRRFAAVLNTSQKLLADQNEKGMDAVTFEEPALFELGDSENPFDLDELSALSPAGTAIAKFLIKLAVADGHFGDPEKQLIFQAVEHMGESLTHDQYERLISEASHESLERILKMVGQEAEVFREKLLLLGMLLSAADGQVNVIEKKLLAQALPFLGISKQRYSEIARDALALIKARQHSLPDSAKAVTQSIASQARAPKALAQAEPSRLEENTISESSSPALTTEVPAVAAEPDRLTERTNVRQQEHPPVPERPAPPDAPVRSISRERQSAPPPPERKIWRCPACHMPQFSEFEECPQCGVIVSKFKQKLARRWEDSDEDYMVDIPSDKVEESGSEPDVQPPPAIENDLSNRCAGCRTVLPAGVKFCPSCGTRVG